MGEKIYKRLYEGKIAVCVINHETQLSFIHYFNNHFLFINLSIHYTLTYFTFYKNIYE